VAGCKLSVREGLENLQVSVIGSTDRVSIELNGRKVELYCFVDADTPFFASVDENGQASLTRDLAQAFQVQGYDMARRIGYFFSNVLAADLRIIPWYAALDLIDDHGDSNNG
jgi:hypothetical protein